MKNGNGHIIGANYLRYTEFSLWRFLAAKLSVFTISFVLFNYYYAGESATLRKLSLLISCGILFVPVLLLLIKSILSKRFLNDYVILTAMTAMLVLFDYNKEAYYLLIFFSLIDMVFYAVKRCSDCDIEKIFSFNSDSYRTESADAAKAGAFIYLSAGEICPVEAQVCDGRLRCCNSYTGEFFDAGKGDRLVSNTKIIAGNAVVETLCDMEDSFFIRSQQSAGAFENDRKKLNTNELISMILQGVTLLMIVTLYLMRNSLGDEKAVLVFITVIVGFFSFSSFSTVAFDVAYKRFSKYLSTKGVSVRSRDEIDLLAVCRNPYEDFPPEEQLDDHGKKVLQNRVDGILRILNSNIKIAPDAAFDRACSEKAELSLVSSSADGVFKAVNSCRRFKRRMAIISLIKAVSSVAAIVMFFSTADFAVFYLIILAGYLAMAVYADNIR